jgi:hypothetical protein
MILRPCLACLVFLAATASLRATPNSGNPDSAFDAHLKDAAGPLVAEGEKMYQQIVASNRKQLEAGRPERIRPEELAETVIALHRLNRLATRLERIGETAGHDFQYRRIEQHGIVSRLINAARDLPPALALLDNARRIVGRSNESRMRELKQIEELAKKGEWEQAETRLYKTIDQLQGLTMLMTDAEVRSIFQPYSEVRTAIDSEMEKVRWKLAVDLLASQRDANAPQMQALLQEIDAASKAVAQSGAAEVEGQMLAGPALATHFGEKWKALQTSAVRCRAANWALSQVRPQGGYNAGSAPAGANGQGDPLELQYVQFRRQMGAALAGIIQADAGRADAAEIESLYQAYLSALAPLAPNMADSGFIALAQQALGQLAAGSPEFAEQVSAYHDATDEMLRWRRRAAEAAAKTKSSEFPPAARQFLQATQAKAPFTGLFYEQNPDFPRAQLFTSAPTVIAWAEDKLLEKPVWVPATIAVAAGKTGVSRYEDRTYCTVALPPAPAASIAALERDLMVGDSTPPLSLAAAAACESARRGDFASAGGTIRAYHLESVLARFGNLPQSAWVLSRLGELPPEPNPTELASHVLARFDVTPVWSRHEYFFAELPATGE